MYHDITKISELGNVARHTLRNEIQNFAEYNLVNIKSLKAINDKKDML